MEPEVPDDDHPPDSLQAAAPDSALAGHRARRQKSIAELFTDLVVPRYDPEIYVRFRPVVQRRIDAVNKAAEKSKDRDKSAIANAVILADACIGIFEVVDGVEVSIDPRDPGGAWPKFDERLAEIFELPAAKKASEVVRGLYLTDGDVIGTASKLAEWSGYATDQLERDEAGN